MDADLGGRGNRLVPLSGNGIRTEHSNSPEYRVAPLTAIKLIGAFMGQYNFFNFLGFVMYIVMI